MTDDQSDRILEIALDWHRSGKGAVLATVQETWGSAPRQAGSQLVVSRDGEMMGSVSGGCVEGAVVIEAVAALADGKSRLLTYGVSDENAFSVGLACGGTIKVLVEPVGAAFPVAILSELVAARAARRPVALQSLGQGGDHSLIPAGQDAAVDARLRSDKAGTEADGRFIVPHNPPLRLIVVGAVHIAQPLVVMARVAGYDVTLIDPRAAFGSAARFPGERIIEDWPDEAMVALAPDSRSAIVTLTHDPKLDDPAIIAALASPAFFIGCLGSRQTHVKRLDRLRAAGVDEAAIARLHAPVGLRIGAKSPAEIAISILGEVTQVLRQVE